MRVKLISDGTWEGSELINAETGEPIEGCADARFELRGSDGFGSFQPTLTLTFVSFEVEVEGAEVTTIRERHVIRRPQAQEKTNAV